MQTTHAPYKSNTKTSLGCTIFRRGPNSTWQYITRRKGKSYNFPLGYDEKEAKKLADQIKAVVVLHGAEEARVRFCAKALLKEKGNPPTIDQTLSILDRIKFVMGWSDDTVRGYKTSLNTVVRVPLGKTVDEIKTLTCAVLTPELLARYKHAKLFGITDEKSRKSTMRTINKNIRQVKAIFGDNTKVHFKKFDMAFAADIRDESFYRGLRKVYRFPKSDVVKDTFALAESLKGDAKTILNLALYFGLRRGEILHCRRDWFDISDTGCRINIYAEREFKPKGGHEGITVASPSYGAKILNEAKGLDHLIADRVNHGKAPFDEVTNCLREIGYTVDNGRDKPLHEARKLFGSYIATTQSLYIAQKYLRHASASTTNESYADVIVDKEVLQLWAA